MPDRLTRLLSTRPWLLADGATGTSYFSLGLETGDAPELWNVDFPDRVSGVHQGFINAGSDIILTNSFGGTRHRLKLHNAQDRVAELNSRAAEIARATADSAERESGREIVVAGSLGPTGEIMAPLGALSHEDAVAAFAEQAKALAAGGADALWLETLSSVEELNAALEGAGSAGLPILATMSFDTNGRTMMGVTPAQLAGLFGEATPRPVGFGANCGTGAAELMAVMVAMGEAKQPSDILVAKSNCGVPEFVDGELHYTGTPEIMAAYACMARDSGVRIIGGCCGTTAVHIQAMRAALESTPPGDAPSLAEITGRLGEVSRGAGQQMSGEPLGEAPRRREGRRRGGRRGTSGNGSSVPGF